MSKMCSKLSIWSECYSTVVKTVFHYARWSLQSKECSWLAVQTWWCHEMETHSALLVICQGNPVGGGSSHKRPAMPRFVSLLLAYTTCWAHAVCPDLRPHNAHHWHNVIENRKVFRGMCPSWLFYFRSRTPGKDKYLASRPDLLTFRAIKSPLLFQ